MNPPATIRFTLIIKGLCEAVAARISAHTITDTLIKLIWTRLRDIEASLLSLATQIRAGTLRAGHSGPRHFAGRKPAKPLLPHGFGWLLPLVPQQAPAAASQLRHLLADPEMADLIAATPRMARALRPLCHMLGLPRDLLPPTPPRPRPQPVAAEPAQDREPPPSPEPGEAAPSPPPPDNPDALARAGPAPFLWPWLLTEQP